MIDLISYSLVMLLSGFTSACVLMFLYKTGTMTLLSELQTQSNICKYLIPSCDYCLSFRLSIIFCTVLYLISPIELSYLIIFSITGSTSLSVFTTKA